MAVPSILLTDSPSFSVTDLFSETRVGSSYQPCISPITPDDVDLDFIQDSWAGEQVVHNIL